MNSQIMADITVLKALTGNAVKEMPVTTPEMILKLYI
jgi:hypothetical protein